MKRIRNQWSALFALALFIALCALPGVAATNTTITKKKPVTKNSKIVIKTASTHRARSYRAKAALYAREVAHTQLPRFKTEENGDVVPDLHAEAAVIYDPGTKQVVWQENAKDQRSIASITKIMTAVVFLESVPDLDQQVKIVRSDVLHASTTYLHSNDKVTV